MAIPGSEYLSRILHVLSQSFLIPCIIALIVILVMAFMELGSFTAEVRERKNSRKVNFLEVLQNKVNINYWMKQSIQQFIKDSQFPPHLQQVFEKLISNQLVYESKQLLARELLDTQENKFLKTLEKTDLIAKLGPILGLMGTLIPLGPGLAALGEGNLNDLAQAVIVAFDTTVVGIAAGGIAFMISKIRRRWYEKDLNDLELFLDYCLGGEEDEKEENKNFTAFGRRH
ncbi:Biopolymer transport protein ExbB/TolQ [Carboxydocella thermautotrophica]|nr:Biopolymer transport protein ExbB/TolQ [Carboxydocella thermautotrophica]